MSLGEGVAEIIRQIGVGRLAGFDGCSCGRFEIACVEVDIACGKGSFGRGVWVWSSSVDYWDGQSPDGCDEALLRPVMDEVVKQLDEHWSFRGPFERHYARLGDGR